MRRRLLRWGSWFAVGNAGLFVVVGLRYLWYYTPVAPVGWIYAVPAFVGHLSALAYLPFFVLLLLATALIPNPRVILPLGVILATAGLSLLLLDSLLFAENRYHLSVLTLTLFAPGTWAFLALYFLVILAIEAMLARWIWQRSAVAPARRIGRYLALTLGACFVGSQLVHAWAAAHENVTVTALNRYLPLYYPLQNPGLLARLGLVDRYRAHEMSLAAALGRPPTGTLNYPLAPLRCEPHQPIPNVLLVVVDAMRVDALTPTVAPHLADFASDTIQFHGHYSGGNTSRPGMFSLFYGLPATYWDGFAAQAWPPLLMDFFRRYDYDLGLFIAAPIYRDVGLDRTALARLPNLRAALSSTRPGASGRDWTLTEEWLEWTTKRSTAHPFFGFLYYDAVVSIEPPDNYPLPVPAMAGASKQARLNALYQGAVHYDDSLIGKVLDDLRRRNLLDRTIVIITSDHGMEFDEDGLGFTGHGTSYSDHQIRVPLLIRWPGRPPGHVVRRTSHYDVVPTLFTHLFGCVNPPSDYASGHDLFSSAQWDWLITASYRDFAVVDPERVTLILPAGYEIRDRTYRLATHPTLPREALRSAVREMSRFYR